GAVRARRRRRLLRGRAVLAAPAGRDDRAATVPCENGAGAAMTPGLLPFIAAGAVAGLGLALCLAELRPAPVRMDAALARLDPAVRSRPGERAPLETALGQWLAARASRAGGIAIPHADLALLGRTPETFLVRKVSFALAGLVSFALAGIVLAVGGVSLPWPIPVAASLLVAAGMFMLPDIDVRAEAGRRRRAS